LRSIDGMLSIDITGGDFPRRTSRGMRLAFRRIGGVLVKLKTLAVLCCTVLAAAARLDGAERLRIHAPATTTSDLTIYVSVERDSENRRLTVTAESTEFYRRSEIELHGEASPRVSVFKFQQLPSGEYDVKVELGEANGRRAGIARCSVVVLGS
jgi:hypothetical protein